MQKKKFIVVKIKHEAVGDLKKFMRQVDSSAKSYVVTHSDNPGEDFVETWFKNLSTRQEKSLIDAIKRRGGSVVEQMSERQAIRAETKRKLRNSAIYFGITYFATLAGMPLISPGVSEGQQASIIQALWFPCIPAAGAFLTRLAIELKL